MVSEEFTLFDSELLRKLEVGNTECSAHLV